MPDTSQPAAPLPSETPNFGMLLAPVLGRVADAARPRFLALLERTAADRYRTWAEELPAHHQVLTDCAQREDEIADRVEALFAIDEVALAELRGLLPEARELYYAAFAGLSIAEQLRRQADAELQGANAWRSIAKRLTNADVVAELDRCSAIEELSSRAVSQLLSEMAE